MKMEERLYEFPLSLRYYLSPPRGDGLVIALHGFQDNAASMLKRIGWLDQDLPFQLLAVNGPFPVPVWSKEELKEAYSWYFRDRDRGIKLVTPETTAVRLGQFLKDLNLRKTRKVIFGFSQGGYLAPYLTEQTENVAGIVGTGCGYDKDAYRKIQRLPVLAIHGAKDRRVDLSRSRSEHEFLLKEGFTGEFIEVADLEHRVQSSIEPLVRAFVLKRLKGSA
jgi:predicted esterase